MDCDDTAVALKVRDVQCKQVGEAMDVHGSHKPRVMYLGSRNRMSKN